MMVMILAFSLIGILLSPLLMLPKLFAASTATCLCSLAGLSGAPRWLVFSFWLWLNLILFYLLQDPAQVAGPVYLIAGFPVRAFWMLVGIWIIPVFIWPLGFLLTFKSWLRR